jgi:hypothetical protein
MEQGRFGAMAKGLAVAVGRRRVLSGLGGGALAAAGLVAAREDAAAGCRERCRRRCGGNRGPKCQDRCERRRCD